MIRVQYRWAVSEGQETAFEAAWHDMTLSIRSQREGARGSQLLRDPDNPTRYVALATWKSRAHWEQAGAQGSVDPDAGARMRAISRLLSTEVFELVDDLTI